MGAALVLAMTACMAWADPAEYCVNSDSDLVSAQHRPDHAADGQAAPGHVSPEPDQLECETDAGRDRQIRKARACRRLHECALHDAQHRRGQ
jgi:hypothetical protein